MTPRLQGLRLGTRLVHAIEREFTQTRRFELFTGSRSERNILLHEKPGHRRTPEQVLPAAVSLIYLEKIR